jgi:hypothetical protein
MDSPWRKTGESGDGKAVHIEGPNELLLEVDHDDINPDEVDRGIEIMLTVLNEHWPK